MCEIGDLKEGDKLEERYLLIHELGRGSFGVVWEVEDLQSNCDRKAIKICTKQDFGSIEQFHQEYHNLNELSCDRIVKVESLYPQRKLTEQNFDESFHFFVMEKVEGKVLENLIKESSAKNNHHRLNFWSSAWRFLFYRYPPLRSQISYLQLADWIEQLAEVLQYLHGEGIAHHDLKPANIMITHDNNIKLIDFGIAKSIDEEDPAYIQAFDAKEISRDHTYEYAPQEQKAGQGLLRSDFYNFGQTIIFAMTGQARSDRPNDDWEWQCPPELVALLKRATNPKLVDRHADADELLDQAKRVVRSLRYQFGRWAIAKQMSVIFGIAAIATSSVLGLRSTGILRPLEFTVYDQMIRLRPDLGVDPRLLIINMTNDIENISDQDLVDLLTQLERYDPRAIGISLRRDQLRKSTPQSSIDLEKILKKRTNIFGACEHGDITTDTTSEKLSFPFLPPPITPLGFGNTRLDTDDSHRRHLLIYRTAPQDKCEANGSFSLLLAHHYLRSEYKYKKTMLDRTYTLGEVVFQSLEVGQSAYQGIKIEDEELRDHFHIMLDYRSPNIAEIIPVKQVLAGDFSPELIRDRIVLIGRATINRNNSTSHITPYGERKQMTGVEIKAQLISQLISAAIDKRPILRPAGFFLDLICVIYAASLGAFLGWRIESWQGQSIILLVLPSSLYVCCFIFFATQGLWFGAVPIMLVAIVANSGVFLYNHYQVFRFVEKA